MDRENLKGQIHNAVYQNTREKGWVAPVDVLMDLGILSKEDYTNWRFGRIPFLEKACMVPLKQLSDIMREIRAYAEKTHLKPSWTCYQQWGKNNKRTLRFSKSGDETLEYHYATHFVDTNKAAALKQAH